ncbi:MAG: hypothetical protein U0Q12_20760 [Vicinamibacterales bacterium]
MLIAGGRFLVFACGGALEAILCEAWFEWTSGHDPWSSASAGITTVYAIGQVAMGLASGLLSWLPKRAVAVARAATMRPLGWATLIGVAVQYSVVTLSAVLFLPLLVLEGATHGRSDPVVAAGRDALLAGALAAPLVGFTFFIVLAPVLIPVGAALGLCELWWQQRRATQEARREDR